MINKIVSSLTEAVAGIFDGATINTPSMLCVEDYLNSLNWAQSKGGVSGLIQRTQTNFNLVSDWVEKTEYIEFLATDSELRSPTAVCLKITASGFKNEPESSQRNLCKKICQLLEDEGVAFDINGYRTAPPGLRIWCGPTVEAEDVKALLPWLNWAIESVIN